MTLVRDVMSSAVISVSPGATFRELVRLMLGHRVGALLVVDPDDDHLAGIVTEADLVSKVAYGALAPGDLALLWEESTGWGSEWVSRSWAVSAGDLMSSPVICTVPVAPMAEAARVMLEGRVKHLPVVEDHRVVGIISRSDLLRPFERTDAQVLADVESSLTAFLPDNRSGPAVAVQDGLVVISGGLRPAQLPEIETRVAALPGVVAVRQREDWP